MTAPACRPVSMPSVTLTRIPIAMKDREPEFFDVIQPIVFGVTVLGRDHTGHVGNLTVVVDGLSLFTLTSFPLSDLARQAALWSVAVDDADHCTAFIYRDEQDRWLGAFRIEPRPDGWQFTSVFEDRRHSTMLELDSIRDAIAAFLDTVEQI